MDIKMQQAINELKALGIEPVQEFNNKESELNKLERQLISDMEKVNGLKYSEEQINVLTTHGNMAIIACAGSGKALRYGTRVLTIKGWKNIEDLTFNDKLLTYDGKVQNILGIYPQGKKKIYKVKFSDGSVVDCCSEHLWEIKTSLSSEWLVENTLSIQERLKRNETVIIPNVTSKLLNHKGLITSISEVNKCYINEYNKSVELNKPSKLLDYLGQVFNIMDEEDNIVEFLSRAFKNINEDYLNRIFTIEMANIIRDISIISGKFYVLIENDDNTYKLVETYKTNTIKSKYESLNKNSMEYYDIVDTYRHNRVIVDIEETEEEDDMVCIKVSDPSCLYVIDNFIVTHNTTVLTNLIVKRVLTGEIKDFRRMICTTYSTGGATEMETRLNALLNRFNINTSESNKIRVYTLHAFFLHILRTFGVDKAVCKDSVRLNLIASSAKECNLELRDNDLDDLSNLISYQTNCLLTDEQVLNSEANTFDNLDIKTYSSIRKLFAKKKNDSNIMDFDDMQTFLYVWLCKYKDSTNPIERNTYVNVRAYCRSIYDDFYIDEAQDVSKIQFEIIKSLVTVENDTSKLDKNLVLVGDDDQCLVGDTSIMLSNLTTKKMEDIKSGNEIKTVKEGKLQNGKVSNFSISSEEGLILEIKTKKGYTLKGTYDHKVFMNLPDREYDAELKEQIQKELEDELSKLGDSVLGDNAYNLVNGVEEEIDYNTCEFVYLNIKRNCGVRVSTKIDNDADSVYVLESFKDKMHALHYILRLIGYYKYITMLSFENMNKNNWTEAYLEATRLLNSLSIRMEKPLISKNVKNEVLEFADRKFICSYMRHLVPGMIVPVVDNDGTEGYDIITDVQEIKFKGLLYDISIPRTKNFVANNIVVHNCIYKWRGADPSIILNIGNTFDMHIKMLSTNYRCESEIVDFAKKSIKFNKNRYDKSIQAYNKGGKVETVVCDKNDLTFMSEKAVNKIKELLDRGEKESNICVMARNNLHLAILSNMLFEQGIYCDYPKSMKLTNTSMYKDMKDILLLVSSNNDSNITKRILWKLVRYMSIKKSENFTVLQTSCGLSLKDSIGYILWASHTRRELISEEDSKRFKSLGLPDAMIMTLVNSFDMLFAETKENLIVLYDILKEEDISKKFLCVCTMYVNCAGQLIYKRIDKNRTMKGVCNYFYRLIKNRGLENTLEFLRLTEQYEHGAEFTLGDKVTLTTIHSAKGKEWKNVIAFAVDSISMPSEENIVKLLDSGATSLDIQDYIDEERRLYYVEITRGKEYVYVITNNSISPFLIESNSSGTDEDMTNYLLDKYISTDSYIKAEAEESINKQKVKILEKIKNNNTNN